MTDQIDKLWREHAIKREGLSNVVYLDTLGKKTGGIGHLLTPAEREQYNVGDGITKKQVEQWFEQDSHKARRYAEAQAAEIGITAPWFIVALISVNFQLGGRWTKEFRTTYPAIVRHDFDTAIKNLTKSKWMKQTPVRVEDFIQALEKAKTFKNRPLPKTRTVQGAGVATVGLVASETVTEVADQIEPLAPYSDVLQWVFVGLALAGIILTVYARLDDRNKGHR